MLECEILSQKFKIERYCSFDPEGGCVDCPEAWEYMNGPIPLGSSGNHVNVEFPQDGGSLIIKVTSVDGEKSATQTHTIHKGKYTKDVS